MSRQLSIRNATDHDAGMLADIYNHYVTTTHITFDLEPVTPEQRLEWIGTHNQNPLHRLLVGVENGTVIGYASSNRFRPKPAYNRSVETTIYLAPDQNGKGYGNTLYKALLAELRNTDVHRCYGIIALPNDASVALHKRHGFIETGLMTEVGFKFDQYWDTLWMEKKL